MPQPTRRIYWEEDQCLETESIIVAIQENSLAFEATCFYPGGGGQPHDTGTVQVAGNEAVDVVGVSSDEDGVLWHQTATLLHATSGQTAKLKVDAVRRRMLARYHTVLHILNTVALRDYNAWITGVQIATDYSRIDFKIEGFSPALCAELEQKVNGVITGRHALKSYYLPEEEFAQRSDLLRTLEAKPPVLNGRVRVVEIEGFDAQACGGTHMENTLEVGKFTITKTENKGRINKRLYVKLD